MQIKILDTLFDLDVSDADTAEKIENALEDVNKEILQFSKVFENMKTSQSIKKICQIVFSCVNSIFGEGSDKKIFGNKCNLKDAINAMTQLSESIVNQSEEINKFLEQHTHS